MPPDHNTLVRNQFDRQVGHYLASSAMADPLVINAILKTVPIQPGQTVLDIACGAGFLLRAYRDAGGDVYGVDLADAMLREAAKTLGPSVDPNHLIPADAAELPFDSGRFDLVTCKLAFHYFRHPTRVVKEMARVCRRSGRILLIDRVSSDDPRCSDAQNRLEKLRTPNKVRVYQEHELIGLLSAHGLAIIGKEWLVQPMAFEEWMLAAGALHRVEAARRLLIGPRGEDLTGLAPREEKGRLVIHHRTLILVGKPSD
jgi:ubiquinone/menaquinone biosynthesis C-methylase UbiE